LVGTHQTHPTGTGEFVSTQTQPTAQFNRV
jgi:hypothetical protein